MRRWTVKSLQANLRKRFADKCLYVRKRLGQVEVYRVPEQEKTREMSILKLPSDASKDYILKRMYEMDTQAKTMVERDLDQDTTENRVYEYEQRKQARNYEKSMRETWEKRKIAGKGRFIC